MKKKTKKPVMTVANIYIVHCHERGEGSTVLKAFNTQEAADAFAKTQPQNRIDLVDVEQVDLELE